MLNFIKNRALSTRQSRRSVPLTHACTHLFRIRNAITARKRRFLVISLNIFHFYFEHLTRRTQWGRSFTPSWLCFLNAFLVGRSCVSKYMYQMHVWPVYIDYKCVHVWVQACVCVIHSCHATHSSKHPH